MENAYRYMEMHHMKLETEEEYPYTGKQGLTCKCKEGDGEAAVSGFHDVARDSASMLKAAVNKQPVSVAVEANQQAWQFYKGGIVKTKCGKKLDHGVLVVGYDTGEGFFKVKNSWGPAWGEEGYIRISDSAENVCGILSQPTYPTVPSE